MEFEQVKEYLVFDATETELNEILELIDNYKKERFEAHKKALWHDVITAINRYQKEVEEIIVFGLDNSDYIISDNFDEAGNFYLTWNIK